MSGLGIFSQQKDSIRLILILAIFGFFIPVVSAASPNDACFSGNCHDSNGPKIDKPLYDSNPHKIINCIECHEPSVDPVIDSNHGQFIRQLNGSKITGPLTTSYNSQNFYLCYYCHAEKNVVGLTEDMIPSAYHINKTPIIVSSIGTNFINIDLLGYHNGTESGVGTDIPTNIHWNHLDSFGSINYGMGAKFDSDLDGFLDSYQSCPACHNVHGTNYPKMTKNDIAITYSSDDNGTFVYIGSEQYKSSGGDAYCSGICHTSGPTFKYYRNEINLFDECVSCHVDDAPGDVNRTAFSLGVHVDINTTGGAGVINNTDCWTCHFNRDMDINNIRKCEDCHVTGITLPEPAPIISTHISDVAITNYSCSDCHSKVIVDPGTGIPNVTSHYLKRPIITSENYCDYCHGPNANSPFNATNKSIPAFNHDDETWGGNVTCRTCHTNSSVSADPLANNTSSFHDLTTELGDAYNGTTKADCFICHVEKSPQFVAAPSPPHEIEGMDDCRGCHTSGTGTEPQKLHSVTAFATGGCIACHSNNATRYYSDTSKFGRHAKINTSDDPNPNNVTDADCMTCHFGTADGSMKMKLGAANYSNTYFCDDCHVSGGRNPAEYAIISGTYKKDGLSHGSTDCKWCHIAGASLPRPLPSDLRYHPNGPIGTAAGKSCLTCHYSANLPDLPFHAPGEAHESDITQCSYCHAQSEGQVDNHLVIPINSNTPPLISGLSVTTPVFTGSPIKIEATVNEDMMQIAAAQYQIRNGSNIVKDWTNMSPKDGRFNSLSEVVNASIDTSTLLGTYTLYIKGMASAPKTGGGPYYPLNGQWSKDDFYFTQFTVKQPEGYDNGTVYGTLGVKLAGAKVSTNTGVYTYTNETGFYSLSLVNGTYQLTASKEPEYYPNSSVSVTVTAFTTVTQDIILTAKPTGNITGKVTNK